MKQLELHKKISDFLKQDIHTAVVETALELLVNEDAKKYFYAEADEGWLNWLWTYGFLNEIKNKVEVTTSYSYRMPELEYLTRMAEKRPAEVAEIINAIKISKENFNPEVIDRFMWIIGSLPAEQIKTLTAKMRDEKWVYLMGVFRKSGYEFERILKKLTEKNDDGSIIELSQAMLLVKSKQEMSEKSDGFGMDDPFYVSDLDASGIFEALSNVKEKNKEKVLQITSGVMTEVIKLSSLDETKVFQYTDLFSLYDIDFFTLEIEDKHSYSYREDIKNLAATIKKIIEKTFSTKCGQPEDAKRLLGYIDAIPTCRAIWRLRLFALVQCPDVFREELKEAFFRLFGVDNYYDIEGGVEYQKALKVGFPHLSDADQRTYVTNIFAYFSKKMEDHQDQAWHRRTGWEILSSICESLTEDEARKCEEVFGSKCDGDYAPESEVGVGMARVITHRSPVDIASFTVIEIIENLKTKWTQDKLNEQFKDDEFHNPRGIEGLGDAIKEDVKKRTDEYLININSFFDRDKIHSAYIYSLLRGIEEMLRNKQSLTLIQSAQLFGFFDLIRLSGTEKAFRRKNDKSWLADWIEVHKVMTDSLLYILEDKEKKTDVQTKYREQIKDLISYLFTIKDSPSKDQEKGDSDPHHVAINSVRGRAYEVFVVFTENDGKVLADDVKAIYKKVLADDSVAVRFMVGRYLATFYFRGKDFIKELLPEIFPKDVLTKKDLYLASWEGYLSNTLYDKLFIDLSDYYNHAINLDSKTYTDRKYSKSLDESLAIHIALAYAHLGLELTDPLFEKFWSIPNKERHQEFISFIGRSCLSRDQAGDKWLRENKVSKEKLLKFWDWALANVTEPEAFYGFGFWINPNKEVLSDIEVIGRITETLKKSNGGINWDYGLMMRLPIFAEKDGSHALEIVTNFLLDSNGNLNQNRRAPLFSIDKEIKESLDVIYKNGDVITKQKVADLIELLIEKGSSTFWGLKDVLK